MPRFLNLERKSCEHLRWTHLEQVQHWTDLPRQRTLSRKRWGLGWNERYRSSRGGEELEDEGRQEKIENRRPILKKPCAVLLQLFWEQHGKKIREVPGVTGTVGKANSHFDSTQKGS